MGRKRDPPLPLTHAEAGHEFLGQGAGQLSVVGCSCCTVNRSRVRARSCRKQPALHGTGHGPWPGVMQKATREDGWSLCTASLHRLDQCRVFWARWGDV